MRPRPIQVSSQRVRPGLPSILGILGLAAVCGLGGCDSGDTPSPDSARGPRWEALSDEGRYRVVLEPESGAPRTGPLHAWVVSVSLPDGSPVEPTRLTVGGGMPQHGHGFATAPRVTRPLGDGRYLVEGVKFHMPGEWTFQIGIVGPAGGDSVSLVVPVAP
jgi:hypothetical protein